MFKYLVIENDRLVPYKEKYIFVTICEKTMRYNYNVHNKIDIRRFPKDAFYDYSHEKWKLARKIYRVMNK